MQFLVGINAMSKEEKASLLAQIECFASLRLMLGEGGRQLAGKTKAFWQGLLRKTRSNAGDSLDGTLDYTSLAKRLQQRTMQLASLNEKTVDILLKLALTELVKVPFKADPSLVADKILRRAARSLKIKHAALIDSAVLEQKVFEGCINEQIERLQKRLSSLSDSQREELNRLLLAELEKMGQADQEALRQAIGVEELSADALVNFLKTTTGVAMAQLLLGSFGFGAFLFLTTFLKAFSLLLGTTFSFGTYLTATGLLAFILSFPFLLLLATSTGGIMLVQLQRQLADEVAKLVVLAGRSKLLS